MAAFARRWLLVGAMGMVLVAAGCNMSSLAYFFNFISDDTNPPEFPNLVSSKRNIKVVLLVSAETDMRPEFLRVDRDLSALLSVWLQKRFKDHGDKVTMVKFSEVENFKDRTPNWRTMDWRDIGKRFHADYVINLELSNLSLYEKASGKEWFRGYAQVSASAYDTNNPDAGKVFSREYSYCYPTQWAKSVMDNNNPIQFRSEFLRYMVKQLARSFATYTIEDKYPCE
jgi:hypothetical protein